MLAVKESDEKTVRLPALPVLTFHEQLVYAEQCHCDGSNCHLLMSVLRTFI